MGQRGYIGAFTSPVTTQVSTTTVESVPYIDPRRRLEGENSTIKPVVIAATNIDTTKRAAYIGAVESTAPLTTTLTVTLSAGVNVIDLRGRLRGGNSTVKPTILEPITVGLPKTRMYFGDMVGANTVVLLDNLTVTPIVTPTVLRSRLSGENSTIKPLPSSNNSSKPSSRRVYLGQMGTSAPLTTTIDTVVASIMDVSATHARLQGENSTIKPAITQTIMPEATIDRRIYIGGDFFTGNLSGNYTEWDPTILTDIALKGCRRFWGVVNDVSITGSQMQALSGKANIKTDTHQIVYPVTGGYLYYALPKPLGLPTIYVNGFMNTAWITSDVLVIENGVFVTYTIYRSLYMQHGNNINLKIDLPL